MDTHIHTRTRTHTCFVIINYSQVFSKMYDLTVLVEQRYTTTTYYTIVELALVE
jgi:hypothetical protein